MQSGISALDPYHFGAERFKRRKPDDNRLAGFNHFNELDAAPAGRHIQGQELEPKSAKFFHCDFSLDGRARAFPPAILRPGDRLTRRRLCVPTRHTPRD